VPKHGNSLAVQLVLNGMKLQQCRPSFFDARNAIIQADQVLTDGENFCDLWLGFAERGLGMDATFQGSTQWEKGIRTNVSISYMTPDSSLNVCRALRSQLYAGVRSQWRFLLNHHQVSQVVLAYLSSSIVLDTLFMQGHNIALWANTLGLATIIVFTVPHHNLICAHSLLLFWIGVLT
jgi:Fungalysin metallopeptidase (M36)